MVRRIPLRRIDTRRDRPSPREPDPHDRYGGPDAGRAGDLRIPDRLATPHEFADLLTGQHLVAEVLDAQLSFRQRDGEGEIHAESRLGAIFWERMEEFSNDL